MVSYISQRAMEFAAIFAWLKTKSSSDISIFTSSASSTSSSTKSSPALPAALAILLGSSMRRPISILISVEAMFV